MRSKKIEKRIQALEKNVFGNPNEDADLRLQVQRLTESHMTKRDVGRLFLRLSRALLDDS